MVAVPARLPASRRIVASPNRSVRTSLILPAFNEEHGLAVVIDRLAPILDATYELIVVDDGSTDRTADVADARGAILVRHERNLGKGAALRSGFQAASGQHILTMDADDTYPVEVIPEMTRALERFDVVTGVRQYGREHIGSINRFGNAAFRTAISIAAGRRVRDPLTGLYGLRRTALQHMALRSQGFGIEAEIVITAGRLGMSVLEIPIEYRSRVGQSKLNPWRDGVIISRTIVSQVFAMSAPRATTPVQNPPSSTGRVHT
jgi:glycosyltransferase involved in cell wall biosynthesis